MKTLKNILFACFFIFLSGCSKDDSSSSSSPTTPTGGITIDSEWQYSIKVDGTSFAHVSGAQNFQGSFSWGASLTVPPDSSSTSFGSGLSDNNSSNYSLGIDKGTVKFLGNTVDTSIFIPFIHTGSFPYTSTTTNGISITWVDANGDFWATNNGTGDQTGSVFTITDIKKVGFVLGNYQIKFKATFNCKLYDFNGNSKTLTDGVYVGKFENYN